MVDLHDAETNDAPPLLADRYRLHGMLGAGGMGAVYRAHDRELDEVVALKILTDLDESGLQGFREEVKLARRITHRNVARTFDIGEHQSTRFLTMEYVEGSTLRRVLAGGRLDTARALDIGRQICAGVAAVHEQGVVHGDIKPDNVLVTAKDHVKVSDFGIARILGRRDPRGSPGTPAYMAPEHIAGTGTDTRSDVFALGCVLVELFTGARPWTGTPSDAMVKRLAGTPPELKPGLPADLEALVVRCLAVDAALRPSAEELAGALAEAAAAASRVRIAHDPAAEPRPPALAQHTLRSLATRPESRSLRVAVCSLAVEHAHDGYLGIALASDIERLLARAPELEVLRGPRAPAETADADAVVEGSLQRAGTDVRIALRLVSKREGFLLWARTVVVSLGEAMSAVESASAAIARGLTARPAARSTIGLRDPKLLDLYLRARSSDFEAWRDDQRDNSALYGELLEAAPDDPVLLASYSLALGRAAFRESGLHARARHFAEEALHRAPELPEAHLALGGVSFLANELEAASRALVRALELAPSLAAAHSMLGQTLLECGAIRQGLGRIQLALRLDPRLAVAWALAAPLCAAMGDADTAAALLAGAVRNDGGSGGWLYWITRTRIAMHHGGDAIDATAAALAQHSAASADVAPAFELMRLALLRQLDFGVARAAIQAFHTRDAALARVKVFAAKLIAEFAIHFGELDAAEEAVCAADDDHFVDVTWLGRSSVAVLRGRPKFDAVRLRTSARAARVLDALRDAGVEATADAELG